ncbi:hypothetical protein M9H77_07872 [Catharanthus roseus]|uniref:Uncharacterized protein n=1 Tax=Catharanthus roseus TaxID=4058 RepID=A0ACC0BWE8_CATRO|nr:hypothetical protein M9H77_07872 [Catharanthus roseus]
MVRPNGRRGDDDLGHVTDRTGRVEGRTITVSSRGLKGRHSTSDLPSTPNPLPAGFHYDTGAAQEPLNEFSGQSKQIGVEFFYQMVGADPQDSSYNSLGYTATAYGVSSSKPYIGRHSTDRGFEGDRGLGEEHDRVRSLHIDDEADERVDDDGDSDDGDQDDGEDAGDEDSRGVLVTEKGKGWPAVLCRKKKFINESKGAWSCYKEREERKRAVRVEEKIPAAAACKKKQLLTGRRTESSSQKLGEAAKSAVESTQKLKQLLAVEGERSSRNFTAENQQLLRNLKQKSGRTGS